MSHKYQGEAAGEAGEEHKAPPRNRQPNGTTRGEPPVRRSWRPCQMLNQDGELDPHHHHHHHHPPHHHHHHHPPTGRGPPRHRRRPPSGQGQSQAHGPGLDPAVASSRSDGGESRDLEPHPVQQPRPGVARYRRQGDPNPRLRGHRQRQPIRETQDSSPGVDERESPAEVQLQQCSGDDPVTDQSKERGSLHQTPVAVVTPTHLSPGPATHNVQSHPQHAPPAEAEEDLPDHKAECEEELEEVKEKEEEQEQAEDNGDCRSTTGHSSCSQDDVQTVDDRAEEQAERVEEDQEEAMDEVAEDIAAAQGSEITDLCSDTESAASLSMDGPLHSPPPLQSPTPPSSPDVPPFPQLDHFSEDASMSPLPDNDLPEDEDEDCSESCSLSHSTSCSDSYPKTYADFYTESHQKSYPEPVYESYSEPKSHPNSFPEPLKTSYPELHREPCRQPNRRIEPNEAQQESRHEPFTSHREENVQKVAPASPTKGSHHAPRQVRDRGSHHSPLDRSVGCRLHHYDGQSDGEGDSGNQSPVSRSRRQAPRRAETQDKSPSSGQSSSGEAHEEWNAVGEEGSRGSGDAISLAIKDIKEAIEEVKTKAVRSPYTPDQPVEPIWVMRQEVSPTEDVYPLQATTGYSASESPSCYASVPVHEQVSPWKPTLPDQSIPNIITNPKQQQQRQRVATTTTKGHPRGIIRPQQAVHTAAVTMPHAANQHRQRQHPTTDSSTTASAASAQQLRPQVQPLNSLHSRLSRR
ncbi:amyloid beta A4 precursor protein-binding family A member 1-like protein [Lates japonicus]|uniref:Amyloid beta A4 protein-binding family A member 1-like protein n=1 Tax=Lates japonicus TaxID=270547 RepID=A0AAD3ML42_LATJO|nr:amyloid beta A4 precursor protein-binding family A member 1-like protein [Lates japonicus]